MCFTGLCVSENIKQPYIDLQEEQFKIEKDVKDKKDIVDSLREKMKSLGLTEAEFKLLVK
jgi:hypothetical protein